MVFLRRLTAVVTLLVTFLLVLTESGFACSGAAMQGMNAANATTAERAASGTAEMGGMPMGNAADHASPERTPERAPCRFPWAPSGCRDMAPCAPAAMTVAAALPAERGPAPDVIVVARVTAPPSVETPPEPPPPRA